LRKLLKESGLRNINDLKKRYPKAKIYFHQDLDGITSALAMKSYLENNGIEVVDTEVIQYGDKEFSVKKPDARGDVMPVLVDFAHGKPMFVIHTDHHDRQVGAEKGASKHFRDTKSNVETISQVISPSDIFPSDDIRLIRTVDSADFAKQGITPDEVVNFIFNIDKDKSLQKNKMMLGFVINKLVLAFKNKKGFLEGLVMNSQPSLLSILLNIREWMKKSGAPGVEELQKYSSQYRETMKNYPKKEYSDGIIFQYGGGSMIKPGSFDRYTPFRNHPDADFLIMVWPMGLVQVSCNPFREERSLEGVNLGEMAQEVISKWESQLQDRKVPLSTIKWVSETSVGPESVGFTFRDFDALYGDKFQEVEGGEMALNKISKLMEKPFADLTDSEMELLDKVKITAWDLIQANSGGHKCITNISGLNYLGRSTRPPQGKKRFGDESDDTPYVKFTKMVANEFKKVLKDKIEQEGI
jgi:hypothetical protein